MTVVERPRELFGRADELAMLRSFLRSARAGVLGLRGEPGVGKSALLEAAAQIADGEGMRVLRATGAEFEAGVSLAGLSQALGPLRERVEFLDASRHRSLAAALGIGTATAQSLDSIAEAVTAVLRAETELHPVVLIVDDAQWVDRASRAVIDRVLRSADLRDFHVLLGARAGPRGPLDPRRIAVHDVAPLAPAAASDLLRSQAADLSEQVRARLLADAAGNPLALLELPNGLRSEQRTSPVPLPPHLPLTRRLHLLYAERINQLAARSRRVLLVAALHDADDLRPVLQSAAGAAAPRLLERARDAGVLAVPEQPEQIRFRHPLVRASLVASSTSYERRQAHRELADLLPDDPERMAWHLAEASVQPDADVSARLEKAAHRILGRGNAAGAVTTMLRSARLSPDQADRARRLTQAAYVGADVTGDLQQLSRRLVDAHQVDPRAGESLHAATAAAYLLLNGDGDVGTAHQLLARSIMIALDGGEPCDPLLPEALHNLLEICLYGGRPELWRSFREAADRVSLDRYPTLALWVATLADPVRTASSTLVAVEEAIAGLQQEPDPTRIERVATALIYLDRVDEVRDPLFRALADGRRGGAVTAGINAAMLLAVDDFKTGRWQEGEQLADEGIALCSRHGYQLMAWPLMLARGLIAAGRGDAAAAHGVADDITTWAVPRGVLGLQSYAAHIRAQVALSAGDFDEAYEQAASVSPAGSFVPHAGHALWVCMDLVEAAVRGSRPEAAVAHVVAMHEAGISRLSSRLSLLVAGSSAMAAPLDEHELFERALRLPQVDRWPFDSARIRLFYGERLRRSRHPTSAREQLERAAATFRQLGAVPWAERARTELLATRPTGSRLAPTSPRRLTPQEDVVAELAAGGLTNKRIAERLQMSHRTVAAHLRQVFRKLDVPTRAGLRDALDRVHGNA